MLRPTDADVTRPSFMFKAGQASRDKVVRFWRCVAGGLVLVMVVGGVAAFGVVTAEHQQATAVVAELRAAQAQTHPPRPTTSTVPTPEPADTPIVVVTRPVHPRYTPTAEEAPPSEVAAALERRRNILVGGLGLIPDSPPPVFRPEVPKSVPTYPGVFAAPRVEKKPPPATDPDPDQP